MAFSFSGRPQTDEQDVPLPSYVPQPAAPAVVPVTVIAKGVRIEGDFGGEGDMRIDGEVAGKVTVGGTLTVGPEASIKAEVKAGSLVVFGFIEGNAQVTDRVDLKATAKVKGDVKTKIMAMEPGASLEGNASIGQAAS